MDASQQKNWLTYVLYPITIIYKEEQPRLFIASLAYFLLIASYYLIRPTRSTIFMEDWGVYYMPIFYLIIAIFTLATSFLYNYFASHCPRTQLIRFVFIACILSFIFFWLLYRWCSDTRIVTIGWYIWVCVYILFLTAIFWSFNHDIHTSEQSKRLYPWILLGAQIGAFAGSNTSKIFLKVFQIGTYNLILLSALMLCGVWGILEILKIFDPHKEEKRPALVQQPSTFQYVGTVLTNRYALCIAGLVVLGTVAFTVCDIQYKRLLETSIQGNPLYERAEFADWNGLFQKMRDSTDPQWAYIRENLSEQTLRILSLSSQKEQIGKYAEMLELAIVQDTNSIIVHKNLDNETGFQKMKEDRRVKRAIEKERFNSVTDHKQYMRINRIILDKVCEQELKPQKRLPKKDTDSRTEFLNDNDSYMSILNIVMLFVIAPPLLRWLGPGWAICFYPIATVVASIAFLLGMNIYTAAWYAIILSMLHYTLYLVGKESLYVPTDTDFKYKVKAVIDTFGYRLGDAIGGFAGMIYIVLFGISAISGLGIFIFAISTLWFMSIRYTHKEYKRLTTVKMEQK